MATPKDIQKRFNDFAGLDLRSGDLVREKEYSPGLLNVGISKTVKRNLETRKGGKIVSANGAPYLGLHTYRYLDLNGEAQEELIGIDEQLRRRITSTFAIVYSGSGSTATATLLFDATLEEFTLVLDVDGVQTTHSLGTGLEGSPVTLAALKTAVETDPDFAVTITGTTTVPAAMLELAEQVDCSTSGTLTFYEWEAINHTYGGTPPFNTYEARKFETYFENACFRNYQQSAIIATGYEYLHKYDGQTVYRLGLPLPATPTTALVGSGSITDTDVDYLIRYVQKDNQSITDYGTRSEFSTALSPSSEDIDVTIANIVAGTGFNTNSAIVNGPQSGVTTITVDSGHTLQVGDTAYFYDGSTSTYVERKVTARTATTITIAGANVDVADNAVISNNLRIQIYRNTAGGLDYYLVAEIPNDSFNATQVYRDAETPANLIGNATYREPLYPPDLLDAKPKYVEVHPYGVLCAAGDPQYPNTVFFSSITDPAGFPAATHSFLVSSKIASGITGIFASMDELVIFKDRGVYFQGGDPTVLLISLRKEHEGQVGAVSNASILEAGNDIWFLSYEGPRRLIRGVTLEVNEKGSPMESAVDPIFRERETDTTLGLQLKRSVGFVDSRGGRAMWFIPSEDTTNSNRYPNSDSRLLVLDYEQEQGAWFEYDNVDFSGGMADFEETLWWVPKLYDSSGSTLYGYLWRRHTLENNYDHNDHHEAIEFYFSSQWDDGGEPENLMLVGDLRVYSQSRNSSSFMLEFQTERDYLEGVAHSFGTLDFSGSMGGYGVGGWGLGLWGSPSVDKVVANLSTDDKFEAVRFVFSSKEYNQKVTLTGYSYSLSFPYRRRIRGG